MASPLTPAGFTASPMLRRKQAEDNRIDLSFALPARYLLRRVANSDHIAHALHNGINEWRIQSFDNFGIDVRPYPVPSAFELHDCNGRWVGFDEYYLDVYGKKSKRMFVDMNDDGEVKVYYRGQFKHISAYLCCIIPEADEWQDSMSKSDLMHQAWRQQADWWRENRKVFRFLDLPGELRDEIYEHLCGPSIEPYSTSKHRNLTALGRYMAALKMPTGNILRTSRGVMEEASSILFTRVEFVFQHYSLFQIFTANVEQRMRPRIVTLALSHHEFMRLFNNDHIRKDRKNKTEVVGLGYPALALRGMVLNRLRLVFAAPSLTTPTNEFDGACQRMAIDMILDLAHPVLRGHNVTLHGSIKASQKEEYEADFLMERMRFRKYRDAYAALELPQPDLVQWDEERDEEVGGVPVDGSMPETEPEKIPALEYDLVCHCDPPCAEVL